MDYTEKLHLALIGENGTFADLLIQGNQLANQLELLFGANYSDYQNLSNITADIEEINNDITTLGLRDEELSSRINSVNAQLNDKIDNVISNKYKGVLKTENGDITGTFVSYTMNVACSGGASGVYNPIDETHRNAIFKTIGSISIDAYELANIVSISNLHIISATASINSYDITNNPIVSRFVFNGIYKNPSQTHFHFNFNAENIDILEQTLNPISQTWQPTPSGTYQDKIATVNLLLFFEDAE